MFLRKLTVMVLPLLMTAGVCLLLQLLNGLGFFSWALGGLILGAVLALLLPLSGATSRKEPFASLLWVPLLVLILVVAYQYLHTSGILVLPVLSMLATTQTIVILVECAFIGFMACTSLRTR